jgi:hypothetical protein
MRKRRENAGPLLPKSDERTKNSSTNAAAQGRRPARAMAGCDDYHKERSKRLALEHDFDRMEKSGRSI